MFDKQTRSSDSRILMWAVVQTGVVACAAAFVLDGGRTLRAAVVALLGYWLIAVILWSRPGGLRPHELLFTKYGVAAVLISAATAVFVRTIASF